MKPLPRPRLIFGADPAAGLGMTGPIRWYSMNKGLQAREHEEVDLLEAMQIVDDYFTEAGKKHDSSEEAVAATMFGFFHSRKDFIEICINGPRQISYRLEMEDLNGSWFRRLFNKVFQYEEMLDSRKALEAKVREFFTMPMEEIKRRLMRRLLW